MADDQVDVAQPESNVEEQIESTPDESRSGEEAKVSCNDQCGNQSRVTWISDLYPNIRHNVRKIRSLRSFHSP